MSEDKQRADGEVVDITLDNPELEKYIAPFHNKLIEDVDLVDGVYPEFEIEYSDLYDPCLSGTFEYNGQTIVIILRFDENNVINRAEVW